jgi:hypothetical protein
MRSFCLFCLVIGICWPAGDQTFAAEFHLLDATILRGEVASADDNGLVVRLAVGGFSPRVNWSKLTQETLKELAKNPEAANYVEPFIEIPPEVEKERRKKKEIIIKPVPRVEAPEKIGLIATITTPAGLAILAILFLANIYAAYEIAVYRNRPAVLVCGLSILLPFIAPLLFLSMPSREEYAEESSIPQEGVDGAHGPPALPGAVPAAGRGGVTTSSVKVKAPGGLTVAQNEASGTSTPVAGPAVYKRGDSTFNRRFFETKFPGFFRVVPSEAEKDLVIVIKGPKAEYVAKRISRISMNEMHVQTLRGGAEVAIPFGEIVEVQVKHKDAKG